MIEDFLKEKEKYVKNILMAKPNIIASHAPSIVPTTLCGIICTIGIIYIWFMGEQLAQALPLDKIPFDNSENILQLKILSTTVLAILAMAALNRQKSVIYTLTDEYLTVQKGQKNPSTQVVLYDDIKNISTYTGLVGFLGKFGTVKITRKDNSTLLLLTVPNSVSKEIKRIYSLSTGE